MKGEGRLKETLPCFYFGIRFAILPAFGSFTGNYAIRPTPDDRVFVVAGDEVVEVKDGVQAAVKTSSKLVFSAYIAE
jgi:hypothetical protein